MFQNKGISFINSSANTLPHMNTYSTYGLSSSTGSGQQFSLNPSNFRPKKPQGSAQTTFVCIVCLKDRPMTNAVMLKSCVDHYYICRTVFFFLKIFLTIFCRIIFDFLILFKVSLRECFHSDQEPFHQGEVPCDWLWARDPREGDEELSRGKYFCYVPLPGGRVLWGQRAEGAAQEGWDAA